MRRVNDYQNKKVLILGFARSGLGAAKLLLKLGAQVIISDNKNLQADEAAKELMKQGVIFTQVQTAELIKDIDLLVKNPGITYENPVVKAALAKPISVITEVELGAKVFEGELIAITGSNGKTTTTTLITKLLAQERKIGEAKYAGNIGIPVSEVAPTLTHNDTLVTEVSSFQLMGTHDFHPHYAVLNNIFASHLDYHKTRANYVAAKMRITINQDQNDFFIVNWDSSELRALAKQSKAQVIPFSRCGNATTGAYVKDDVMYWQNEKIMTTSEMGIPGDHNVENALAAIAVAKLHGRSNEMIAQVLRSFSGVRHRTQFVLEANKRQFYNDSKATDIEATQMALKGFNRPVVLIAGGLDRGDTYERLEADLKQHVKAVVLCGETKAIFARSAKKAGIEKIEFADDIQAAVTKAYALTTPGDIVLLSPAAASWDQYPSFEVRGDLYIEAIEKLTGKKEV
ncbi:UDP-N-acetylmuramoylalanine--D-glutamate ligase [Weissella beninensis]|uniref:UDP-N-acetylmuramoylalanine--D-glutamate ligase n=1 Tax=Periweissella beninensis TaxID=504936 RepID=A0ABT0VJK4_9LACO|nr:UDP-N-acetylmuramoyl-L-alanine--D-glutamate ligase [Periweissella beninensis]MBM7544513.1 UDP-N-acetylmuramoylalanine--D-glutamate ligase [Periweissella beninensis]MCM2438011.1 UDP-N-acetylmuramoyl-L-alanine--D-glutamate ligase [Periweissella beninensis]